jgi:Tfp pilus assembly protein PilF
MKPDLPDYYESNLDLLKKHHPHVYKTMAESSPEPVGEVFISPKGKPNLRVVNREGKVVKLHDEFNPEDEVFQFLEIVPENSTGFVSLIGMGLGYSVLALIQQRPYLRHLAVFELEPGIFKQALHYMDLSPALSDPRLMLSITPNPEVEKILEPAGRALRLETIHTLKHIPSFSFNNGAYKKISDKLFDYVNDFNLEGGTKLAFGNKFVSNRLKHLSSIHYNYLLESLQGAFSRIPAILVAGGPSLDKNIHLLPTARDRAVIIAVDTVLPALLAHGVPPHFVTSIDYKEETFEKFAHVAPKSKGISLICSSWVSTKVTKIFPAEKVFWIFTRHPIENWINTLMGGKISTGGASSVAQLNLTAAILMGCSPIIFVGQDLSYSGSKSHVEHAVMTNKDHMNKMLKSRNDLLWVKGTNSNKVPTSRGFHSLIKSFEKMMSEHPGHYINATEGGAHLDGTEVLSLKKSLDFYCSETHNILDIINFATQNSGISKIQNLLKDFEMTLKQVKDLRKTIKNADVLSYSVNKEIDRLQNIGKRYCSFSTLPKPLQEKIKKIDALHKHLDNANKIWQILQDVSYGGIKQSERMLQVISKLKDNPEQYMEWLVKNLNRLDSINRVREEILEMFEEHLSKILRHHKKEKKLLSSIENNKQKKQNLFELARLYFKSGDMVFAKPVLEKLLVTTPTSAEIHFCLGTIAAHQTEYQKAENYFKQAKQLDPAFSNRIKEFLHPLGEQYFVYAERWKNFDMNAAKRLLIKGLRYCEDHAKIQKELKSIAREDLEKIKAASEAGNIKDADSIIKSWHKDIEENKTLSSCLTAEQISKFYQYHGNLLMSEKDAGAATESFKKALTHSPNNPDLHVFITDSLFAKEDFALGLMHLKKAVKLDRNYAILWENIGDNLQKTGQIEDAIAAYEQGFLALPENISLLKKMGDCYRKTGQSEAAQEAYKQLKLKLEEINAVGDSG